MLLPKVTRHVLLTCRTAALLYCLPLVGLGESYSSQFADSISAGNTNSNVGVIAGTLAGAAKSTVGSVSVSSKKSAQSQSLSTSKSGAWHIIGCSYLLCDYCRWFRAQAYTPWEVKGSLGAMFGVAAGCCNFCILSNIIIPAAMNGLRVLQVRVMQMVMQMMMRMQVPHKMYPPMCTDTTPAFAVNLHFHRSPGLSNIQKCQPQHSSTKRHQPRQQPSQHRCRQRGRHQQHHIHRNECQVQCRQHQHKPSWRSQLPLSLKVPRSDLRRGVINRQLSPFCQRHPGHTYPMDATQAALHDLDNQQEQQQHRTRGGSQQPKRLGFAIPLRSRLFAAHGKPLQQWQGDYSSVTNRGAGQQCSFEGTPPCSPEDPPSATDIQPVNRDQQHRRGLQ